MTRLQRNFRCCCRRRRRIQPALTATATTTRSRSMGARSHGLSSSSSSSWMQQCLLLLAVIAASFVTDTCASSVPCTTDEYCIQTLRDGSICSEDGYCTNPFYNGGCLKSLLGSESSGGGDIDRNNDMGWHRIRVCNSDDPPEAIEKGYCRLSPFDYMEVRILAQGMKFCFECNGVRVLLVDAIEDTPFSHMCQHCLVDV